MHESIDLDTLAAFVQTARLGSFSAAGRVMGKDPSVLTRRIAALENRLGVRLLARTTRSMKLTEAGALYLAQVENGLAVLTHAHAEAEASGSHVRGTLRVALPLTFGRLHVTPRLGDFLKRHPELRVDARLSDQYVNLVDEGFDVAVRLGVLDDSNLVARRVADYEHRIYAAPAYLRDHGTPETPADLAAHSAIGFAGFRQPERWPLRRGRQATAVTVPLVLTVDDGEALIQAAEAGCGLLLVADWLTTASVIEGRLVPVLPAWTSGARRQVHVVTAGRRALPAKTRAFVDWAMQQLRGSLDPGKFVRR